MLVGKATHHGRYISMIWFPDSADLSHWTWQVWKTPAAWWQEWLLKSEKTSIQSWLCYLAGEIWRVSKIHQSSPIFTVHLGLDLLQLKCGDSDWPPASWGSPCIRIPDHLPGIPWTPEFPPRVRSDLGLWCICQGHCHRPWGDRGTFSDRSASHHKMWSELNQITFNISQHKHGKNM